MAPFRGITGCSGTYVATLEPRAAANSKSRHRSSIAIGGVTGVSGTSGSLIEPSKVKSMAGTKPRAPVKLKTELRSSEAANGIETKPLSCAISRLARAPQANVPAMPPNKTFELTSSGALRSPTLAAQCWRSAAILFSVVRARFPSRLLLQYSKSPRAGAQARAGR